jgi:hypothetical protein
MGSGDEFSKVKVMLTMSGEDAARLIEAFNNGELAGMNITAIESHPASVKEWSNRIKQVDGERKGREV